MFSKFKLSFILFISVIIVMPIKAQQFVLKHTIEEDVIAIFDIDGDGACEYITDINKVYDGMTDNLKFTFPIGSVYWDDEQRARNPNSNFPHIDFNGDGNRELIIELPSDQFTDERVIIYDLINNQTIFDFDPPSHNANYKYLLDYDGDNELELVFEENDDGYNKFYIYSTGITTSALLDNDLNKSKDYELKQNFPNPFNPSTTIEYEISKPEIVKINIYDVTGRLVKEIVNEQRNAGKYSAVWNGRDNSGNVVASGSYFYQIISGDFAQAKKMILLK